SAVIGWDLAGGNSFTPVPSGNLLPVAQTTAGTPAEYDVLLVKDNNGVHFISGRTGNEVYREPGTTTIFIPRVGFIHIPGSTGGSNIGDFNGDGIDDVALSYSNKVIVRFGTNTFFRAPTLGQFGAPAITITPAL